MRVFIFFMACFISVFGSGQSIYFNDIQSQPWLSSSVSNVEVYDDHYYIFGAFSNEATSQGTFIQKLDFNGQFVMNVFEVDSALVYNYAEAMNVKNGEIYLAGDRTALGIDTNGSLIFNIYKLFPEIYFNDIFLNISTMNNDQVFIGAKVYDIDTDPSPEYSDVYLLKTSAEGEELWENEFNILPDKFIRISVIHELENGELVLAGSTYSPWNPVIIRVDSLGNLISYEQFGQEEENNWLPWSVLEEDNDRIVMAHQIVYGQQDITDFDESTIAVSAFNLNTNEIELMYESDSLSAYLYLHDFVKTPDGGYAALGYRSGETSLPSFIHKLNSNFEFEWEKEYNHSEAYVFNYLYDLEITPDGGFICAGETYGQNSNTHPRSSWLLKLDACGDMEWQGCTSSVNELGGLKFEVFPNPASDRITVNLNSTVPLYNTQAVFRNTLGQEVFATQITASEQELDVSLLPSGVYMLSLVSDGRVVYSERVVIE